MQRDISVLETDILEDFYYLCIHLFNTKSCHFSHLHHLEQPLHYYLNCRTGGHMNTREEVKALFDLMENTIGHERTAKLHAHFSHIEYNDKGEVRHLTFADTVYGPDFTPVAEETAARGYAPTFICESAGTQAEDALAMKQCFMAQAEK